jgi:ATP dependent DNA ligase domain
MGEFVVYHNDQVLDRKTGNGILNSLQQGSDIPDKHKVVYHVWDWRPEDKDCDIPYTKRLETARKYDNGDTIKVVKGVKVNNYQEALSVAGELIANGYEGGILKNMNMPWSSGTSKQQVKLKVECDIDLLAVEFVKGDANGKHANTFGSIKCRSSDGKIEVDVTGMPDSQRKHLFNNPQEVIGKVVTVTFNDIIESKTDRETASLFLPRFGNKKANGWFEIRNDKLEADSSERIIEIFEATTGIRKELKK